MNPKSINKSVVGSGTATARPASMEEAIRSAIGEDRSTGFDVERVEKLPDALPT